MTPVEDHLRLLGIFHYVVGGLMILFGCFPIIHLIVGIAIFLKEEGGERFFGLLFVAMAGVFILTAWVIGGLIIKAGIHLKERSHYTFCLVMAGISCIFFPFGTTLGVFTIITLTKPEAKELFGVLPQMQADKSPSGGA